MALAALALALLVDPSLSEDGTTEAIAMVILVISVLVQLVGQLIDIFEQVIPRPDLSTHVQRDRLQGGGRQVASLSVVGAQTLWAVDGRKSRVAKGLMPRPKGKMGAQAWLAQSVQCSDQDVVLSMLRWVYVYAGTTDSAENPVRASSVERPTSSLLRTVSGLAGPLLA